MGKKEDFYYDKLYESWKGTEGNETLTKALKDAGYVANCHKVLIDSFLEEDLRQLLLRLQNFRGLRQTCSMSAVKTLTSLHGKFPQGTVRALKRVVDFWERLQSFCNPDRHIYDDGTTIKDIEGLWPSKSTKDYEYLSEAMSAHRVFPLVLDQTTREKIQAFIQNLDCRVPSLVHVHREAEALLQGLVNPLSRALPKNRKIEELAWPQLYTCLLAAAQTMKYDGHSSLEDVVEQICAQGHHEHDLHRTASTEAPVGKRFVNLDLLRGVSLKMIRRCLKSLHLPDKTQQINLSTISLLRDFFRCFLDDRPPEIPWTPLLYGESAYDSTETLSPILKMSPYPLTGSLPGAIRAQEISCPKSQKLLSLKGEIEYCERQSFSRDHVSPSNEGLEKDVHSPYTTYDLITQQVGHHKKRASSGTNSSLSTICSETEPCSPCSKPDSSRDSISLQRGYHQSRSSSEYSSTIDVGIGEVIAPPSVKAGMPYDPVKWQLGHRKSWSSLKGDVSTEGLGIKRDRCLPNTKPENSCDAVKQKAPNHDSWSSSDDDARTIVVGMMDEDYAPHARYKDFDAVARQIRVLLGLQMIRIPELDRELLVSQASLKGAYTEDGMF